MRLVGLLSLLSFALVGTSIGLRLLLLARKTRQVPELLIGLGLALMAAIGMPVAAVGRMPSLVATPVGDAIFAVGLQVAAVGIVLLYAFTWQVFRPGSAWAKGAVWAAAICVSFLVMGLLRASTLGSTLPEILPHARPYSAGIVLMVCVAFAWSGAESAAYHAKLQRRRKLGLADAVVTNRFLLWALSGLATSVLTGALMVFLLQGMAILRDPLPLVTVAIAGTASSTAWYLAFLPPERYLRFLRRRVETA